MLAPHTEKEVHSFLGYIQYISRFIAQLTCISEPIFKLLRKNSLVEWNSDYQSTFEKIKNYLLSALDRPLILYLTVHTTPWVVFWDSTTNQGRRSKSSITWVSGLLIETRYTPYEKTCLALVYVTKRLQHYFLSYKVFLIFRMDPIKYLFEKPATIGRTTRWLMMLSKFDISFIIQKVIKRQTITDFLAAA